MKARAAGVRPAKEVSAGGLVGHKGRIYLIQVENLSGTVVWTFPKGHLEAGESPAEAALREVREETGWECRLAGDLGVTRYRFTRDLRPVEKVVHWFRMEPVERRGAGDPDEVLDGRWCGHAEARELLSYASDRRLMARYVRELKNGE